MPPTAASRRRAGARCVRLASNARCRTGERILVLGTSEHVWEPFQLAEHLEKAGADVRFSAVTRSPLAVGHSIERALAFSDNYGLGIANAFLRSGAYLRHLRTIRKAYSETLRCLISNLQAKFGQLEIWGAHNGMHVMWLRLEEHGVHVHTLASGGAYAQNSPYNERVILPGYAALSELEIAKAVDIMAAAIPLDEKALPDRNIAAKA
nr:TRSP domain-containing protein [Rhizobium tibeticum]